MINKIFLEKMKFEIRNCFLFKPNKFNEFYQLFYFNFCMFLNFFLFLINSLPTVTHEAYIDICIDKVRSGRIEIGFFGNSCPNSLLTIERGLRCHYSDYCYRGSYLSEYKPGNSIVIGGIYEDKGINFTSDFSPCPPNQAYLVCYVPYQGHTSGKMIVTLKPEADLPENAIPIGRILTGKPVFEKIFNFAKEGGDVNTGVRISSCGLKDFKDPDIDL